MPIAEQDLRAALDKIRAVESKRNTTEEQEYLTIEQQEAYFSVGQAMLDTVTDNADLFPNGYTLLMGL